MSVSVKPTSQDGVLEAAFGTPVDQLYAAATAGTASPALQRALELRSFLAVAEEQVACVRGTIHQATSADRDPVELSAAAMRFDAQWLEAALDARDSYTAALGELLRTMPPPGPAPARQVQLAQPKITTALPLPARAAPVPVRAGAARARRP
ncbi:hypothetical protein [Streptomyces celluloflavus]|uniref:hypothetical protein n=1 Tax=Streptomyces celluloflavus TaxID=58344 RepID=UPI00345F34B2|nr:hypothetical protein OG717_29910 [Streptomyces celluloflavus]